MGCPVDKSNVTNVTNRTAALCETCAGESIAIADFIKRIHAHRNVNILKKVNPSKNLKRVNPSKNRKCSCTACLFSNSLCFQLHPAGMEFASALAGKLI